MCESDKNSSLLSLLQGALTMRLELQVQLQSDVLGDGHNAAVRLFNGFVEGDERLAVDLYGDTIVIHDYSDTEDGLPHQALVTLFKDALPFVNAMVVKHRKSLDANGRNGRMLMGEKPCRRIVEHGVRYAVDLVMNRDASFYLDTRLLRQWLIANMEGKRVLNTFAYTGSLGVAAMAGGAARVVQTDRNRQFLNLGKESYTLNGFPVVKRDFVGSDFFPAMKQLSRQGERFDCVLLDPPFFSATSKGTLQTSTDMARLVNKVRPLVDDGGHVVVINNALFCSGEQFMEELATLYRGGYVSFERMIPVPADFTGVSDVTAPHPRYAPFNHSTKIAVLRISHTANTG